MTCHGCEQPIELAEVPVSFKVQNSSQTNDKVFYWNFHNRFHNENFTDTNVHRDCWEKFLFHGAKIAA